MYVEDRTSAKAMNYAPCNTNNTPLLIYGDTVPVKYLNQSFTDDAIVSGDFLPVVIDVPASILTESTPHVDPPSTNNTSSLEVDLTTLDQQIDDVLSHEKDDRDKVLRLLDIEDRLETEVTSATIAANTSRYKIGHFLERIKNAQHGLLENVKKAYAERHQRGHGKSTLNKCHTYYKIPGILDYLPYSYEKVLCLYEMAKYLFNGSSDPIGDLLKEASLNIEEVDYLTPVKYLRASIGLSRKATEKGYILSYSRAYDIVAADMGSNPSIDLWIELDSYIMKYGTLDEAVEKLIEAKEQRRKAKPLQILTPPQANEPASGNDHVTLENVTSTVISLTNWLKDENKDLGDDFRQEHLDSIIECHQVMSLFIETPMS